MRRGRGGVNGFSKREVPFEAGAETRLYRVAIDYVVDVILEAWRRRDKIRGLGLLYQASVLGRFTARLQPIRAQLTRPPTEASGRVGDHSPGTAGCTRESVRTSSSVLCKEHTCGVIVNSKKDRPDRLRILADRKDLLAPRDKLRPLEWEVLQQFAEIPLKRRNSDAELKRIRATVTEVRRKHSVIP